jgi:hypothetical protein
VREALPLRLALQLFVALTALLVAAPVASAISAPIHIHGTGTDGVLIRPSPDTSRPALGWMAEGTSPDYHCFTYGQTIGNVNVWFLVTSRGITGYYASYWDDSSYHSEAELTSKYGIPKCGSPGPGTTPPGTTPPGTTPPGTTPPGTRPPVSKPVAIYFSPYNEPDFIHGNWELHDQTANTVHKRDYSCAGGGRAAARKAALGHPIKTLAGWSLGRLGVISFLREAKEADLHTVGYALLIDPGNYDELTCDRKLDAGRWLVRWLVTNPAAQLVVISTTADSQGPDRKSTGIKETYFKAIRQRAGLRGRVLACNYDMTHKAAFRTGQYWIVHQINATRGVCPTLRESNGHPYHGAPWRP